MWSKRGWRGAVMAMCIMGMSAAGGAAVAQDMPAAEEQLQQPEQQQPSKEQMMAQYMALAEPGPEHEALAVMVGTFKAEGTSYCDPSGQPQTFSGTQVNEMILGGRFLHGLYEGTMMDQPFQGAGLTGYDNVKQRYISLWADTMGTSWVTAEGSASAGGKVFTLTGSYDDPVMKQKITMRQVTTIVDDDHYTFEMFGPAPAPAPGTDPAAQGETSGGEMKMMEIKYTRQP